MHPAVEDAALARLLEGNRRYVDGSPRAAASSAHRVELADAQRPFAVVLGCSDSRVPVETIFDQGPGDLFVIRLAGNIVTAEGLGSIEYATEISGERPGLGARAYRLRSGTSCGFGRGVGQLSARTHRALSRSDRTGCYAV